MDKGRDVNESNRVSSRAEIQGLDSTRIKLSELFSSPSRAKDRQKKGFGPKARALVSRARAIFSLFFFIFFFLWHSVALWKAAAFVQFFFLMPEPELANHTTRNLKMGLGSSFGSISLNVEPSHGRPESANLIDIPRWGSLTVIISYIFFNSLLIVFSILLFLIPFSSIL